MKDEPDPQVAGEPAESPPPPPTRKRRGWNWAMVLVGVFVLMVLAGLSAPMVLRCKKATARTEAINNAKQIGMALLEFDREFGSFPDNDTAATLAERGGYDEWGSGDTSNDYLRQLLTAGVTSEDIFYAKTPYTRKPDGRLGRNALEPGEVGFGYVMLDQSTGQSSSGNPGRAVLVTPLLDARMDWVFDPEPHHGKAIVLRLDNSASALQIRDSDRKVSVGNGKTLEETGYDTVWGRRLAPVLKAPAKREE